MSVQQWRGKESVFTTMKKYKTWEEWDTAIYKNVEGGVGTDNRNQMTITIPDTDLFLNIVLGVLDYVAMAEDGSDQWESYGDRTFSCLSWEKYNKFKADPIFWEILLFPCPEEGLLFDNGMRSPWAYMVDKVKEYCGHNSDYPRLLEIGGLGFEDPSEIIEKIRLDIEESDLLEELYLLSRFSTEPFTDFGDWPIGTSFLVKAKKVLSPLYRKKMKDKWAAGVLANYICKKSYCPHNKFGQAMIMKRLELEGLGHIIEQ